MASEIGSLRLVCRAARAEEARALRLRRRLESTARVHLPEALERALDVGRRHVFAGRVDVRLDFDPGDYDDVTLAALWAARVAGAIASAGEEDGVVVYASERELYAAAAVVWADTGGLEPVFETLDCGIGPRVAALPLLAAFDTRERLSALAVALVERPARLRRVRARLARSERDPVLAALAGKLRWGEWGNWSDSLGVVSRNGVAASAAHPAPPGTPSGETVSEGARVEGGQADTVESDAAGADSAERAWSEAWRRCASDGAAAVRFGPAAVALPDSAAISEPRPDPAAATREAVDSRRDRDRARARELDARREDVSSPRERTPGPAAWVSRHAGLVLLYPWLAAHLSADLPSAESPPGSRKGTGARMWALAALVSTDPHTAVALDPLVRALAGDDPGRDLAGWRPSPPVPWAELVEAAGMLLATFAEALPGFAGSSPEYVRREFLERDGRMEPQEDGTLAVRLESAPLDLALARLPYPLAPFSLPWSRTFVPSLRRPRA